MMLRDRQAGRTSGNLIPDPLSPALATVYAQVTTQDSPVEPDGKAVEATQSSSEEDALVDAEEAALEARSNNRRFRSKHESEEARAARDARDRRLVRRLKQGDERAFQELVHTYQDRIF